MSDDMTCGDDTRAGWTAYCYWKEIVVPQQAEEITRLRAALEVSQTSGVYRGGNCPPRPRPAMNDDARDRAAAGAALHNWTRFMQQAKEIVRLREALEEQVALWQLAAPLIRDDGPFVPFMDCHKPVERILAVLRAPGQI